MLKQKLLTGIALSAVVILTGCVSEKSYVGTDKPVSQRNFDNIEAARTRISLGLNYLRRGDTSQAKYNLERARSFAPNSAEVYGALAYYYQSVGENKQAEDYFKQAIAKDNNYADAYNNFGAFLCQLNRYEESEQLLLKAISRPGYIRVAESYENLALCQLQQNNFNKASTYLDNSINHNATRITSLTLAAGLAYAMGDNRQAKNRLDRIQRLGRVSARTVLLSYLIAEKSGDVQTQRSAEQLLLTLYTDTPESRLLMQNKTQDSEFEQLRERYKDSLMANIVVPEPSADALPVPAKPVANPKLKVVKRKTTETETEAPTATFRRPRTERTNTASAIAGALSANTAAAQSAVSAAATLPQPLPVAEAAAVVAVEPEAIADIAVVAIEPEAIADIAVIATAPEATADMAVVATEPEVTADMAVVATEPDAIAELAAVTFEAEDVADAALLVDSNSDDTPFHLVQAAESLYAISVKHNIRLQRLMEWNQLTPESVIKTGQKIWLGPVSATQLSASLAPVAERAQQAATAPFHVVAGGETMFAISYRYNIKLDKFMSWNGLTEQSTLQVGQRVYVVDPESVVQ